MPYKALSLVSDMKVNKAESTDLKNLMHVLNTLNEIYTWISLMASSCVLSSTYTIRHINPFLSLWCPIDRQRNVSPVLRYESPIGMQRLISFQRDAFGKWTGNSTGLGVVRNLVAFLREHWKSPFYNKPMSTEALKRKLLELIDRTWI